jgi:hypothetical protein
MQVSNICIGLEKMVCILAELMIALLEERAALRGWMYTSRKISNVLLNSTSDAWISLAVAARLSGWMANSSVD